VTFSAIVLFAEVATSPGPSSVSVSSCCRPTRSQVEADFGLHIPESACSTRRRRVTCECVASSVRCLLGLAALHVVPAFSVRPKCPGCSGGLEHPAAVTIVRPFVAGHQAQYHDPLIGSVDQSADFAFLRGEPATIRASTARAAAVNPARSVLKPAPGGANVKSRRGPRGRTCCPALPSSLDPWRSTDRGLGLTLGHGPRMLFHR
jgi:hypothetical protein